MDLSFQDSVLIRMFFRRAFNPSYIDADYFMEWEERFEKGILFAVQKMDDRVFDCFIETLKDYRRRCL